LQNKDFGNPVKEGYIFKGWSIDLNSKIEEDTIIKALWSKI